MQGYHTKEQVEYSFWFQRRNFRTVEKDCRSCLKIEEGRDEQIKRKHRSILADAFAFLKFT